LAQQDSLTVKDSTTIQKDTTTSKIPEKKLFGIGVGASTALSPTEFYKFWNTGFLLNITECGMKSKWLNTSLGLDLGYYTFNTNQFYHEYGDPPAGMDVKVNPVFYFAVDASAKLYPLPFLHVPYLTAGIGLAGFLGGESHIENDFYSIDMKGVDDQGILLAAGGGVEIPLVVFKLYAEATYDMVIGFGGVTTYLPVRAGLRIPTNFSFFGLL
jgi:hypothetical protein